MSGASGYEFGLPKASISTAKLAVPYEIRTGSGTLIVPSHMFHSLPEDAKSVSIVIASVDKTKLSEEARSMIGGRPAVELNLYVDGVKTEWNNPEASVSVAVSYTPTAEELQSSEHLTVRYFDPDGRVVAVPSGKYDRAKEAVTFATNHFSTYGVVFVQHSFDDRQACMGEASDRGNGLERRHKRRFVQSIRAFGEGETRGLHYAAR
ncbi:hypothetical protein AB4Z29_26585 [Paenibacillus sp. 2TAB23]|uniref:hypothetical protein n=1 Tax=Paenibacillus sp. 2TAB23 TaxID=3233004 RepID=UPI003F96D145